MKRTMILSVLGLLAAVPAFAGEGGKLAEKLGLDDASRAKVQQTFEKFRAQMAPVRKDAQEIRRELSAELANAQPNDGKVSALLVKLRTDRQQMMTIREARATELQKELTPTQLAKLMMARGHRHHEE